MVSFAAYLSFRGKDGIHGEILFEIYVLRKERVIHFQQYNIMYCKWFLGLGQCRNFHVGELFESIQMCIYIYMYEHVYTCIPMYTYNINIYIYIYIDMEQFGWSIWYSAWQIEDSSFKQPEYWGSRDDLHTKQWEQNYPPNTNPTISYRDCATSGQFSLLSAKPSMPSRCIQIVLGSSLDGRKSIFNHICSTY